MQTFTPCQEKALAFLTEFLAGRPGVACLKGYAGTGKTFLVAYWLRQLSGLSILVCAPTNKALDVLREKCAGIPGVTYKTVDSFLGYKIRRNDDFEIEKSRHGKPTDFNLIVCDEGSMVRAEHVRELTNQARYSRGHLLFVGDPAQLQPVGENESQAFSVGASVTMVEPARQAVGHPIIELATWLRDRVNDGGLFTFGDVKDMRRSRAWDNRLTFVNNLDVYDWHVAAYEKGLDAQQLAFDNVTVVRNNAAMHERLYPGAPCFGEGETCIAFEAFEVSDEVMLYNGETMTVLDCQQAEDAAGIETFNVRLLREGYDLGVTVDNADAPSDVKTQQIIEVRVARDDNERLSRHKTLTDALWTARRAGDVGTVDKILMERKPLLKLAPLRHNYAKTVHKSQGSTYDVAFIDWSSIYRSREMRARLMYVAATRPSKFLAISTA